MKGLMLVTMGSPSSPKEMKRFLYRMFMDYTILPYKKPLRFFLATLISSMRYKKSWKKYQLIGGSPLRKSMDLLKDALQEKLGNDYDVYNAYSYDEPGLKEADDYFFSKRIEEVQVLPMYPQYSISTTGSVKRAIMEICMKSDWGSVSFIQGFETHEIFVQFWSSLIQETLKQNGLTKPLLVFSAHSIPEYQRAWDSYEKDVHASAKSIANSLDLPYKVSYQSKMGRMKWIGPDTKEMLGKLTEEERMEVCIIPISFINENFETLYDLDFDIVPYAKETLKMQKICRVKIPDAHPLLIDLIKNILLK